MIDYTLILQRRYPEAQWALNNNDYTELIWLSDTPKPSKQTLDNLWPEVENELLNEQTELTQKKAAAEAKLAALGLTADDLAALGL